MPRPPIIAAAIAFIFAGLNSAQAAVVVTVDKSAQRLSVSVDGHHSYEWPISTARMGYNTPNGTYRPERLARQWYSSKYDWSPMPHSIFFHGGYAIHGSYEISHLGRPASHGCIRLHPANAAVLYSLVQAHINDTRIVVVGESLNQQARWRPERPHRPDYRYIRNDFEYAFRSGDLGRPRY